MKLVTVHREDKVYKILRDLVGRGWLPLSQMATLLGYTNPQALFRKQKSRNTIATVKVGGIRRVYLDTVKEELETHTSNRYVPVHQREHAELVLQLLKRTESNVKSIRTSERGD